MSVPETTRGERRRDVQQRRGAQSRQQGQHRGKGNPRRGVRHRQAIVVPMVRESVIVIVAALLMSLIVKTWLIQAFYIPSASMEPTLHGCPNCLGDRVLVNKMVPNPVSLRRGDIIVFADPDHWLPTMMMPPVRSKLAVAMSSALTFVGLMPSDEGNHLVKRVIGLPGDHVICCDVQKRLTVNGVPLDEPYIFPGDTPSQETFNIIVPAGKVWVMGDHRSDSGDSRPHDQNSGGAKGSVPETLIVGRVVTIVWPFDRWAWLSNPTQTFAKVPTATVR